VLLRRRRHQHTRGRRVVPRLCIQVRASQPRLPRSTRRTRLPLPTRTRPPRKLLAILRRHCCELVNVGGGRVCAAGCAKSASGMGMGRGRNRKRKRERMGVLCARQLRQRRPTHQPRREHALLSVSTCPSRHDLRRAGPWPGDAHAFQRRSIPLSARVCLVWDASLPQQTY
jgi:hypothetical protein